MLTVFCRYKMYDHAQNTHEFSHRMKAKYRREHPLEEAGSSASSSSLTERASGNRPTSATDVDVSQESVSPSTRSKYHFLLMGEQCLLIEYSSAR